MSAAFSTPEDAVLGREINLEYDKITFEKIWSESHKTSCCDWVNKNNFTKICLQFPDDYLPYSTKISDELKTTCTAKFYILADTTYGSCCVDEIAAAHVEAEGLIHFGNACQSKASRLPVLYIFPNFDFDVELFLNSISNLKLENDSQRLIIYFDAGYQYIVDRNSNDITEGLNDKLKHTVELRKYPSPETLQDNENDICIFVGLDNQAFFNISMSVKAKKWYIYNPTAQTLKETNPLTTSWIRRRYFYIEKCKDAQTIGLIVATLTAEGYLDIVKRMQEMARASGKRTHIISVGRINPAKLANFMEIDCFILIGCPFNNMYTSRDYFKPIVSVFEAEMALNPAWHLKMPETIAADFKDILPSGKLYQEFRPEDVQENDVSLVSGKMRSGIVETSVTNGSSGSLVERKNYELMESNGGTVFEDRTWRGLDQALGRTEPAVVQKGLSGIPTNYKPL